jgi:hypothetical protein
VAPPGTRYATTDPLPTPAMLSMQVAPVTLTVDVPAGVTVTGIVVVLDTQFNWQMPPPPSGAITLTSPDNTMVTLATSYVFGNAANGLTRNSYPSLAQPPPPNQPDLTPFEGKSGSGTWTFNIASASGLQVVNLALYIK